VPTRRQRIRQVVGGIPLAGELELALRSLLAKFGQRRAKLGNLDLEFADFIALLARKINALIAQDLDSLTRRPRNLKQVGV